MEKAEEILLLALIGVALSVAYGFVGNRLMQHGRFGFKPRFFEFATFYAATVVFWLRGATEGFLLLLLASGLVTMVTLYVVRPEYGPSPATGLHNLACFVYIGALIYGVVRCFTGF